VELLVVIGIIALLISILLPSLNKAREAANAAACLSNLRQFGAGLHMYADQNRGSLPTAGITVPPPTQVVAMKLLSPYVGGTDTRIPGRDFMRCPTTMTRGAPYDLSLLNTYGVHYAQLFSIDDIKPPTWYAPGTKKLTKLTSRHFLVADSVDQLIYAPNIWTLNFDADGDGQVDTNVSLGWERMYNRFDPRHNKAGNVLFADGHAVRVSLDDYVRNVDQIWNPG
jgi:prepilin-type processing-associated H-X9-DG protein